jgi:antitoxin component of MazEF toxin-antitoxin module
MMFISNNIFKSFLSKHHLVAASLLLLSIILGYFANHYTWYSDFTQNQRNSLSSESKKVLQDMPEAIEIKALASNSAVKGKYFRKSILSFLARYQRSKNNIFITFISPETDMTQARDIGLQQEGEWLITYKKQSEYFKLPYTEERFTNLLIQLKSGKERTLFFTDGHGEPRLEDATNIGLQRLAKQLMNEGMQVTQSTQLSNLKQAHTLVINAPQKTFQPNEVSLIQRHVNQGRNLIWLVNSHNLQGLESLANALNLEISEGIAVDLSNQQFGLDPKTVTASQYARHEIFKDFAIRTFFPNARRISDKGNMGSDWKITQLIGVAENGWLTKGDSEKLSQEDLTKNFARPGPINIAVSLERTVKNQQQRILMIGNSAFLSNQIIEKGGNLALASKIFKWSSTNHLPINLKTNLSKDSVIVISDDPINRYLILTIFNGFQFVLPAILFFAAFFVWFRRSKM